MGTVFTISCYCGGPGRAEEVFADAFDEVDRIEALLSNYRPASELSRISREGGRQPVTTDPETFGFVSRSLAWSRRSSGAFDITVGPLLRAWGFKDRAGRIPSAAELAALRRDVGWDKVRLDAQAHTVAFSTGKPIELDPGSIGKGYAVDRVAALLRGEGVAAAFISAGGSTLYGLGAPPGTKGWPVEVPDPRAPGRTAASIPLRDMSLSTGACTEKFFVSGGHRYCHIFDPRTLRPVEGVLQSTVTSPSAEDSDALSTVVFVLPPAESQRVLQAEPDAGAILFLSGPGQPACVALGAPFACAPSSREGVTPPK